MQSRTAYHKKPIGVITCFPQLAMCTALWKKLGRHKPAIIAYNYNLGSLNKGWRRRLARSFAQEIDVYVVHSVQEVSRYAEYLGLPNSRIRFVPLQRGKIDISQQENKIDPYIIAMGSAKRDYPLLISAVDQLRIPTLIITREDEISRLPKSEYVSFRSGLSQQECLELLAKSRICVTPVANATTASGQITFLNAMQLGVPCIATRCPGTDGYIEHDQTGILVEQGDLNGIVSSIHDLWHDANLRTRLSEAGQLAFQERFSDDAAADALHDLIRELTPSHFRRD